MIHILHNKDKGFAEVGVSGEHANPENKEYVSETIKKIIKRGILCECPKVYLVPEPL